MVTGLTRSFSVCFEDVSKVVDPQPDAVLMGLSVIAPFWYFKRKGWLKL